MKKEYHILLIQNNNVKCNTYINYSIAQFIANLRKKESTTILVNNWEITKEQYKLIKRSTSNDV